MKLIFAASYVTQWWALGPTYCYKTVVLYIYICCFSVSINSWDTTTSAFRKQTDAVWKFYFRFRFWTFYRHFHVILHWRNKFYPNWTITERVMTLCRFLKMAAIQSQIYFRVLVYYVSPSGSRRSICVSNFDQISQSTAKILLLPVAENKRPPYLYSTPGFDELVIVIGMWFCTDLLNFVRNRRSARELWRHIHLTRQRL